MRPRLMKLAGAEARLLRAPVGVEFEVVVPWDALITETKGASLVNLFQ